MLREDKRARYIVEGAWFWKRYRLTSGKLVAEPVRPFELSQALEAQRTSPVPVMHGEGRQWWWFQDRFFWEDEGLTANDVLALVFERERKRQRKLERAHAALQQDESIPRREPVPREVRLEVWERDGGKCVECGGSFDLQYDHLIPFSMGGATTAQNLQLLCADCNRAKGASL
jgi:5-methylcytosine-specific restriction endonuclease McrA